MEIHSSKRQGFAVITALSLMSLILLLLLSITLLVRVEIQNASNALIQLRAKEAARLALYMALGDLQQHAGPDQRVTARAEILGSTRTEEGLLWTGSWDTADSTSPPRWLVSWQDQNAPPNSKKMLVIDESIVGPDSTKYVSAPIIAVSDHNGATSEEIAWWISDEGVKVSAGLRDNVDNLNEGFFTSYNPTGLSIPEQKQILRQIAPQRFRTEVIIGDDANFVPGHTEDINNVQIAREIETANELLLRAGSNDQLALLPGVSQDTINKHFHDITYLVKSVISDTKDGGLKRDLSDRSYSNSAGALKVDSNLHRFLWELGPDSSGDLNFHGLSQSEINNLADGTVVTTTPPLITEFALYFGVFRQASNSRNARAFMRFVAEVWAPYGSRHQFNGPAGSDTPELLVEIEGLPIMALSFFDKDQDVFTSSTTLDLNQLEPEFEMDLTESHKSGELRRTAGFWSPNHSSARSSFNYNSNWNWPVDDPAINPAHRQQSEISQGDYIRYSASSSDVTLTIKNQNGDILQRITNVPIGTISTDSVFYVDSPSALSESAAPIVFHYRSFDDRLSLESWLTTVDPRKAVIDLSDKLSSELIDLNDVDGDNRGDADIPNPTAFSNLDLFHGQVNNNFYRLFDVPSTIPYSLGILQHAQIHGYPPFAIGNATGGDLNSIFDDYFISGIPQDINATHWSPDLNPDENPLPNPFVQVRQTSEKIRLEEVATDTSAQHLIQVGSFNINSTSQAAWAAIIGANFLYDWAYTTSKGTASENELFRLNLEGSFFRLPYSGHLRSVATPEGMDQKFPFEEFEDELNSSDDYPFLEANERERAFRKTNGYNQSRDWRPSLSTGHRELSEGERQNLADQIVDLLSARERPFISLEEFLNSDLLQRAIDLTSINTLANEKHYDEAPIDSRIPKNATAYLSQADVFSAMAPFATTRSDTFYIQSKGRSLHPASGAPQAEMHCVALIQRTPERVDGDPSTILQNATDFGRRFEIKEVRWLTD